MLHRKRTLEYLQQPHAKLTPTELKEILAIAIELATEQQEHIDKLQKNVFCARSASKGNLVGLGRVKYSLLRKQVDYDRLNQKYEKLVDTLFDLKQSLKKMGLQLHKKSICEIIAEYREKDSFIKELEK